MAREDSRRKSDVGKEPAPRPMPRLALSIAEFCEASGISEGMYYKIKKQGLGPREMKIGTRTLITTESAAEWKATREADTSRGKASPTPPVPLAQSQPKEARTKVKSRRFAPRATALP